MATASRAPLVALALGLLVGPGGAAGSAELPRGVVELATRHAGGVASDKEAWPCIWPLCKKGAASEQKATPQAASKSELLMPKTAAEAHRRYDESQAAKAKAEKEKADAEKAAQEAAAKEAEDAFYREQEALEIA